ncbi:TadG family pilus assembly protein [uncultured Pseudacidovorax sp.]|uniref:TadG family pilus assembly protein n=1 Tax=uncultured Pseudacidovorax sp. TaxID=679313 RepID=UPI0025EBE997|nr:TadG family pilus assembly protein [uncultured Pseudacidovorax sp.]
MTHPARRPLQRPAALARSARRRAGVRRQRGSIAINATLALAVLIVGLLALELGYLLLTKRELQKAADLAALAGAQQVQPTSCAAARQTALANANGSGMQDGQRNLPRGFSLAARDIECGRWEATSTDPTGRRFEPGTQPFNAVRVAMQRTPALMLPALPGNSAAPLTVEAIAARQQPQAALSIRSTLLTVDTQRSVLLDALVGGLLGGSVNLGVGGWNGLLQTDVQLLRYLDALAVDLGVSAGDYDRLLATDASVGTLMGAAITALRGGGGAGAPGTLDASLTALRALQLAAQAAPALPLVKLGELVSVQSGTPAAGLEVPVQLFQLVEAVVQAANSKSAVFASVPVSLPALGTVTVKTKVVEPAQITAIGNPALARLDPMGADRIFVRTAQVRTLVSVELGGLLGTVNSLLDTVNGQIAPLTSFINGVLNLNLVAALGNFLGGLVCPLLGPCPSAEALSVRIAPSPRIDLGLGVGGGRAHVSDYGCTSSDAKTLTVPASTAVGEVQVGSFGSTQAAADSAFFSSAEIPQATAVSILELGRRTVRPDSCLLNLCSGLRWKKGSTWVTDPKQSDFTLESALGLRADTTAVGGSQTLQYAAPAAANLPEIDAAVPAYQSISSTGVIGSLSNTLAKVDIQPYRSTSSGTLGNLLFGTASLINGLLGSLQTVISGLLSPLLDPLLDFLLDTLGIDIATTEVGARLSCRRGAELVF